jgi:EmrB/QacA subfamily drug resistance transporter
MQEQTPNPRRWWILAVLSLSVIILVVDNSILNVAIPTLSRDLGATTSQLQWIIDAYILVFAGLLLTAGSLGDRFGRRLMLQIGMSLFGLASLLAAFAQTPDQLIGLRALMGIGGSMIMPSTLSILMNVFPPHERVKALAVWTSMIGLGVPLGPVLGGWLVDNYWWGSVFLVNLPIVAIAITAGILLIPESRNPTYRPLDPIGALLVMVGMVTLLYGIIEAPQEGWLSAHTLGFVGVAAVFLGSFIAWELRTPHPMLNVRLFGNPRFSGASFAVTLMFFVMSGAFFFLIQHLQIVLGYGAMESGIRTLPMVAGMMLSAPLAPRLVKSFGPRPIVAMGVATVGVAMLLFSQMGLPGDTFSGSYGLIAAALVVMGMGMGLTMAPATGSILSTIPQEQSGVGSAVNETMQQIGGALGIALLGSLFSTIYGDKLAPALQGLPPEVAGPAQDSVIAAMSIAGQLGPQGQPIMLAAIDAFVQGMDQTFMVGAGIALVASLVVLRFLPNTPIAENAHGVAVEEEPGAEAQPA